MDHTVNRKSNENSLGERRLSDGVFETGPLLAPTALHLTPLLLTGETSPEGAHPSLRRINFALPTGESS
jgi:hypothetical protein